MAGKLCFSVQRTIFPQRESQQMILIIVLVEQVVLKHDDEAARTLGSRRHSYEHMRSGVNRDLLLPDNGVHAEIHLVINHRFLNYACVDYRLFVLNFPVVHQIGRAHV